MVKLYKVWRHYGTSTILDVCWAENEEEVYRILSWEKHDKPPLTIEEETRREGCILSVSVKGLL